MTDHGRRPSIREQALSELDRILRELEDGTTSLDDALARYERGVTLLRLCYGQLKDAEQKIQQLSGVTDEGKPQLQPFEHTATVEKSSPTKRK
jgi:exodeoxyribonuclease VII small subunit